MRYRVVGFDRHGSHLFSRVVEALASCRAPWRQQAQPTGTNVRMIYMKNEELEQGNWKIASAGRGYHA
jgi:hypothetical protein